MRRSLTSVHAVFFALLSACGGSAPASRAPQTAGPPAPKVTPGGLEARPLLGDVPLRAAKEGAGALAIVGSGPLNEGERLGAFVDVPKDGCLLVYARASSSVEDIDLAAFADEGTPVAIDERPDPKPAVLVCPPHPDRVYVAVHAASGSGLVVIGAQIVPASRAAEVGRAVGTRGVLGGPPRTPEAWPGLDGLVQAHRGDVGGTWEEQRRVAVAVDPRSPSAVAFAIDDGSCSDALVVPDDDVALLEVEALDGEGRVVSRAKDSGVVKTITLCSDAAMPGSLRIRPHGGRGLVAVVLSRLSKGDARQLKVRSEVASVTATTSAAEASAARSAALTRAGYGAATSPTQTGEIKLGRRQLVPVDVAAACARIDVAAGVPLSEVEAVVWDDGGALVAEADGTAGATLFACKKGKLRLDLGTRKRGGPFALSVRPEKWSDPAFLKRPLAASRMLARAAGSPLALHDGNAGPVTEATLERDRLHSSTRTLAPGSCQLFAVGAEGPGAGLEARIFDAGTGDELDRSHGQHAASVQACAGDAGIKVRFELRATAGKLDVVVGERVTPGG